MPPVVVGPDVRPQLKVTLQEILLHMDSDPEGRQALNALGVNRFVVAKDADYETIREMEKALGIVEQ